MKVFISALQLPCPQLPGGISPMLDEAISEVCSWELWWEKRRNTSPKCIGSIARPASLSQQGNGLKVVLEWLGSSWMTMLKFVFKIINIYQYLIYIYIYKYDLFLWWTKKIKHGGTKTIKLSPHQKLSPLNPKRWGVHWGVHDVHRYSVPPLAAASNSISPSTGTLMKSSWLA